MDASSAVNEAGSGDDEGEDGTILIRTRMLLVRADSRMPRTRTTVRIITTRNAGILKPKCHPGW